MAGTNPNGIPLAQIEKLAPGDEILIGPDFHAEIKAVHDGRFDIVTEYGTPMRITAAAIEGIV